jgi:hypothetical protein
MVLIDLDTYKRNIKDSNNTVIETVPQNNTETIQKDKPKATIEDESIDVTDLTLNKGFTTKKKIKPKTYIVLAKNTKIPTPGRPKQTSKLSSKVNKTEKYAWNTSWKKY